MRAPVTCRHQPSPPQLLNRQLIGGMKMNSAFLAPRVCRRHRDVLGLKWHGVCPFLFFASVHYVHLHDDVIRSAAINLHLTFDLGFAYHRCPTALCVVASKDPGRDSNEPPWRQRLTAALPLSCSPESTFAGTHHLII